MPDCFISFSTVDGQVAEFVRRELIAQGASVFLAPVSIQPGDHWSDELTQQLKASDWVIVLASQAAVKSAWVNQEVGGAHLASKKIVPIVWDMAPTELKGWLSKYQAIDLRGGTFDQLAQQVGSIAARIKADKAKGLLILGALTFAVIVMSSNK